MVLQKQVSQSTDKTHFSIGLDKWGCLRQDELAKNTLCHNKDHGSLISFLCKNGREGEKNLTRHSRNKRGGVQAKELLVSLSRLERLFEHPLETVLNNPLGTSLVF